jgi:hypothetical protein
MATATTKKEEAYPWKAGANSGHTTNLKQTILRLSISMNGTARFKKCKQLFEYKHILLPRDIWWSKF